MSLSTEFVETAFATQGVPVEVKFDRLEAIADQVACSGLVSHHDLVDVAAVATIQSVEALLLNYNPREYAEDIWRLCQTTSTAALGMNGQLSSREGLGTSSEIAVHNLLWWGIAHQNLGRYARFATHSEDKSGQFGLLDGYDLVFRSDKRRWPIQVKSGDLKPQVINKYHGGIIVISPASLTGKNPDHATDYLHRIIRDSNDEALNEAWNNFVWQLRTQKATNGIRKVI